jgi:hypothetical protein|tara:strand:+ start:104 stop:313 length:210 start_codon:yes stop_codon:yes gene_type:complete
MYNKTNVSISIAVKIILSKKDFFLYTEENNKIKTYMLTNDLTRHRNKFNNKFKLVDDIKKQLINLTINL